MDCLIDRGGAQHRRARRARTPGLETAGNRLPFPIETAGNRLPLSSFPTDCPFPAFQPTAPFQPNAEM
eukprot:2403395-Prymnesium_polylepis.1